MSQVARDAIIRTKPYKGGDKPLWRLHKLHNVDKHRLVIAATSALHSVNFEPGAFEGDYAMYRSVIVAREDRRYPVEKGDEIFVDFRNPELDQQIQPFFQVMLNEPGIVECEPLLETVHYMVDLVEHIVATFKPLLV